MIEPGTRFSTSFESGCVATTTPDSDGQFLALDSDRVKCVYHVAMIVSVESYPPAGSHRDPLHRGIQPS